MDKELFEKLNTLDEEIDSSFCVPVDINIVDGVLKGISTKQGLTLNIPEGVKEINCYSFEWGLYSCAPGTSGHYFTSIDKIVFPASLKIIGSLFNVQPQYQITLEFKCDVMELINNTMDAKSDNEWYLNQYNLLINATKSKKEERVKRFLCSALNIPYPNTEFIFDIPIDINSFYAVDVEL